MKDAARPATSIEFWIDDLGIFAVISVFNMGVKNLTYKILFYTNKLKIVISSV